MTPEISTPGYAVLLGMTFLVFMMLMLNRVPKIAAKLWSLVRMILQLALLGFYLAFLFEQNSSWLNMLWFVLMVMVAGWSDYLRLGKGT
jgi:putative ABC transport system permease protein